MRVVFLLSSVFGTTIPNAPQARVYDLCSLPNKNFGFGIADPDILSRCAFIASSLSHHKDAKALKNFCIEFHNSPRIKCLQQLLVLSELAGPNKTYVENAQKFYAFKVSPGESRQSLLYQHYCQNKITNLKNAFTASSDTISLSVLAANNSKEATCCFSVLPTNPKYKLSNKELQTNLCYKYSLPLPQHKNRSFSCICGEANPDPHHLISGCQNGGFSVKTHNAINRELAEICKFSNLHFTFEDRSFKNRFEGGLVDAHGNSHPTVIPDITIHNPQLLGYPPNVSKVLLDVSVVGYTAGLRNNTTPNAAFKNPTNQLQIRYQSKISKYTRFLELYKSQPGIIDHNVYEVIPIVILSTGTIHPKSQEFIAKLAERAQEVHEMERGNLMTWFIRRMVFALMRGISDTLHGKVVPLPAGPRDYTIDPNLIQNEQSWGAD